MLLPQRHPARLLRRLALGFAILCLAANTLVAGETPIAPEELTRIGIDAYLHADYETAVEKLQSAQSPGATVSTELQEAQYFQSLWNGLQAEANGFKPRAEQYYKAAATLHPQKPWPKVALQRLGTGPTEISAVELAATDDNDEKAIGFRQRAQMILLKYLSSRDVDLDVRNPADYGLGVGIDGLTGAVRQKIVTGSTEDVGVLTERLVASESSAAAAVGVIVDEATSVAMSAQYGSLWWNLRAGGSMQSEVSQQSAAASTAFTFRLWYEIITRKRVLREPTIGLDSPVLLGEWLDNYGTHFISEVLEGGWVQLTLRKQCSSAAERQRLSERVNGAIGGSAFGARGEVTGEQQKVQALDSIIASEGLSIEARAAGASGTFDVDSVAGFLAKRAAFKKEVLESKNTTPVRVRLRSFAAPEVKRFPFSRERFTTAIRRMQARSLSNSIMALVRADGRAQLGSRADGSFLWNPRKERSSEVGERYRSEVEQKVKITRSSGGIDQFTRTIGVKFKAIHEVLETSGSNDWKERVRFEEWEQPTEDGAMDASLQGQSIIVLAIEGKKSVTFENESKLTKAAKDWVQRTFAGSSPSTAATFFPKHPVGAGSEWKCDIGDVARVLIPGFDFDEADSSVTGHLTNVRLESGSYLGNVDVAVDLKLKGLGDRKFVGDSRMKVKIAQEQSLQPQKARFERFRLPITMSGMLDDGSHLTMEGKIEGQEVGLPRAIK